MTVCDLCMYIYVSPKHKTKRALTHPYLYSFHKNYPLYIRETSHLPLNFLFMPLTQMRVGRIFSLASG